MTTTTYRDDLAPAELRREALLERCQGEIDLVLPEVEDIQGARTGRIRFGLVAVAGALIMGGLGAASLASSSGTPPSTGGAATAALVLTWPLAILAYGSGRLGSGRGLRARVAAALRRSDDVHGDIARLEHSTPGRAAAEIVDRAELASVALPLAGLSLIFPLTLHLLVGLLLSGGSLPASSFDVWIGYSVICAGLAHLVLAALCLHFAERARRSSIDEIRLIWVRSAFGALGWSALAAVLPTIVFAPIIVVVTGIAPVPLMFWCMVRRLSAERASLSDALG